MERGGFQSKRSRGGNLPRVARRVRAARLRLSRSRRSISTSFSQVSTGPRRLWTACSKKARSAASETRKPSWRSAMAMSSLGIVAPEIVRNDVAVGDVVAQRHVDRDGLLGGAPVFVAQHPHLARVVGTALDGFCDGLREDVLTVEVEQLAGLGHHASDVAARYDPALDEDIDLWGHGAHPIATGGGSGAAFAAQNLGAMFEMLDLLPMPPGSGMVSDDGGAVQQPNGPVIGDEGERALDVVRGHRIDIGVEAGKCGFIDEHRLDDVGGGHRVGQRKQALLLLDQAIGDRALREIGMSLLVRDSVDESEQLVVAVLDVVDVAASEEALAKETDLAFHATLLVSSVRGAQPQLDVHGAAEIEEQRMEASGVAVPLEHDDLGIIEEPLARGAGEVR